MNKQENKVTTKAQAPLLPPRQIFSEAWRLYVRKLSDFVEMYLWGLIGVLPLIVTVSLSWFLFTYLKVESTPLHLLFWLLSLAALALAIYYGSRAKIGLFLILKDESVKVKDHFIKSKDFFWPYLGVSLATGILIALALLLLIVPGVILAVFWSFAAMLIIMENKRGVKEAMARSKELVTGYFWPVFWRFLFIGIFALLIALVLNIPMSSLTDTGKQAYTIVMNVFWALLSPLFLAYTYLLYKDLLTKK